jgi:hypothetical protein
MLWALIARVRDEGYEPTREDLRALMGSGCSRARLAEVMGREGAQSAAEVRQVFAAALAMLATIDPSPGGPRAPLR